METTETKDKVEGKNEIKDNFFAIPAEQRPKLSGFEFYEKVLGSPKYVVAPMVDASELAWRMLSRRHGAQLCYTPMYHSYCFAKDPKYRKDALQSCPEDRPLILQFCGNDPKLMLEAALLAQDHCDAIDINLGCPQQIAKRGRYGAFLQDEWDLLTEIVGTLHKNLLVPVTCKIRVFPDINKTIQYAKMLEKAGAQILTIHGRTRDQKGPLTGVADWNYIKIVRQHVKIPVFANGNIMDLWDVHRCLEETGVNGVMSAEGNLQNPALFAGVTPTTWDMALEYLDLLEIYPAPRSYVRGHVFKVLHHLLNLKSNHELRERIATCQSVQDFRDCIKEIEVKYRPYHEGEAVWLEDEADIKDYNLKLPPWICQPYIRAPPEEHIQKLEEHQKIIDDPNRVKRQFFDSDGNEISRKKMKKLRRSSRRPQKGDKIDRHETICSKDRCFNTRGLKCEFLYCKSCCRDKCYTENLDCTGHKCLIKTRRDRAMYFKELEKNSTLDDQAEKDENLLQDQLEQSINIVE